MKKSPVMDSKGFTLIEIIVCLVLLGILGLGVATYFAKSVEGFMLTRATSEASQKVNLAMERLSREIKNMDLVSSSTASSLCFDRDGTSFCVQKTDQDVTLARDSGTAYALIDDVRDFKVTLLDGDGNTWSPAGSTDLRGLSRVEISLEIEIYQGTTRTFSIDINPLFNSTVNSAT